MNKTFNKKIFKGIITPAEWKNGIVSEISIHTTDEDEYIVEQNEAGKEMFLFLRYPVEVSGYIKKRKSDGKLMISVEKCVTVIASNNDVFI